MCLKAKTEATLMSPESFVGHMLVEICFWCWGCSGIV